MKRVSIRKFISMSDQKTSFAGRTNSNDRAEIREVFCKIKQDWKGFKS